jgi:outer membrane protein insertion porin family
MGYPVLLGMEAWVFDRAREDWLEDRIGGSVSLGYKITQDLVGKMTYRFERVRVGDITLFGTVPDAIAVAGNNYVSAMKFSLTYDRNIVDKYFILCRGYALSASYEIAGLGGDAHFSAFRMEGNWQTTLLEWPSDHKWVLQLSGEAGYMAPFGGQDVPIYERFFAGGPHSIRGFAYRGVGPMFNDKPEGGDAFWTATAEFSFPIFQHILRGVAFVDAGDLESRLSSIRAGNVRIAAGFGARITLPIFPAPIALDFGFPLVKQRTDQTQVFSFSVGVGF